MRLIIAGSRDINMTWEEMHDYLPPGTGARRLEIVSGNARGPDSTAIELAKICNIPCKIFEPNWNEFGKAAGIIRNKEMGDYADELLAFWDGKSRGTKHMIDYMTSLGKPVKVVEIGKTTI